MDLAIRPATPDDLPLLAAMNKRMIEDEKNRNPMSLDQLQQRMAGWLGGDWQIDLVTRDREPIGYTVYQRRQDEYYPDQPVVFVRHFYIERGHRGQGIGTAAFAMLRQTRFPPGARITLEVLATNPLGKRFWTKMGFQPYCTTMQLPQTPPAGES